MEKEHFDLLDFIPEKVRSGKKSNSYNLIISPKNSYIKLEYFTNIRDNLGERKYSLIIPRKISKNTETYEVLGLLQAEMSKTYSGCVTFANSEFRLINKVINWFDNEIEINPYDWRWYIKVNIQEPTDEKYKKEIEEKVIKHWLKKTKISLKSAYPKKVSYIKDTKNTQLKNCDYGCLVIENKSNLFSQIIKNFVKTMTYNMPNQKKENISYFMRGIIAGEGCVECNKKSKKYRIHISAVKEKERIIFQNCLSKLRISSKKYTKCDRIVISKRKNNIQLLKQKLMCLSPKKYNKFLYMMQKYPNISNETNHFTKNKTPWNKIPQETINKIIEIKQQNPSISCKKAAKEIGVSPIKINRVWKQNNLGERLVKTSLKTISNILKLCIIYPYVSSHQIAEKCQVHKGVVHRARKKYNIQKFYKPYSKESFSIKTFNFV